MFIIWTLDKHDKCIWEKYWEIRSISIECLPLKCNPVGAISWHLPIKQRPVLRICLGFISTLSVIFKQKRVKQISLALHHRHCWLIWLTDEYEIISNPFSASKHMKHWPALGRIEGVISELLCFSPPLVGHKGQSTWGSMWARSLQQERMEGLSSIFWRTTERHCHREYIPSLSPRAFKWKGPALD